MQTSFEQIWSFLNSIVFMIPPIFIYLTGIILSLVFRKRAGKAAIFTLLACVLFLTNLAMGIGVSAWVQFWFYSSAKDYTLFGTVHLIEGILRSLLHIVAFALLFVAIFGKRNESATSGPPNINEYDFNRN